MLVDWTPEKELKVMRQGKDVWFRPHYSSHINEEISMLINQWEDSLAMENKESEISIEKQHITIQLMGFREDPGKFP